MIQKIAPSVVATAFLVGILAIPAEIIAEEPPDLPGGAIANQLIIHLTPGGDINGIHVEFGTSTIHEVPDHDLFLISLPEQMNPHAMLQAIMNSEQVQWVEFNQTLGVTGGNTQSFFFHVGEVDFHSQYALELLDPPSADGESHGEGIVVAVLDTGIDATHDLLAGAAMVPGYNFIDMTDDTGESAEADGAFVGHGTFMAGLIHHLAPGAALLPITVLDEEGVGDLYHVVAGMLYAVDHGADLISLGLGSPVESDALTLALDTVEQAGALVVAAAGNDDTDDPVMYPAADPRVIAVAATNVRDLKSSFSSYGQHIDISAPGTNIVSAIPGNEYASTSGSSPATALVSGTLALLATNAHPDGMSPIDAMMATALPLDELNPGYAGLLGAGRLRTGEAFDLLSPSPIGDLNGDGVVDVADLLILFSAWGQCDDCGGCPADLTDSCSVGVQDLLILVANWG